MQPTPSAIMLDLFWLVFYGSAPALAVAAAAGLTIAILQGVMQINDQTLPQVVKMAATMVVLVALAGMSFGPIYRVTVRYLELIPTIAQ